MSRSKKLTRRGFLGRAAGAFGAVAAGPYVLTSGALGAPGRPGANDRIGLGFIGIGNMGGGHLGGLAGNKDFQILAISDVKAPRAQWGKDLVEKRYAGDKSRAAFRGARYKGCDLYLSLIHISEPTRPY